MGSPVVQFLLESMAAPLILAGLLLTAARRLGPGRWSGIADAGAIIVAVCTTYVLAFGLPADLVFNARAKIMLSALGGLVIGIAVKRWTRSAGCSHIAGTTVVVGMIGIAGAIGIPIWVGLPALLQGRPESLYLAVPIAAALAARWLIIDAHAKAWASRSLIALTLAVGLAAIAAFGKAFSFAELGLSLGSALLAILAINRQQLAVPAALTAAAMLLALFTAILLYGEASPLALCILGTVIGAERLAGLISGGAEAEITTRHTLIFCALPAAVAILIARIDAGPFSIY